MSQVYGLPVLGADTLAASRVDINDSVDAVRSHWAGVALPASPANGDMMYVTGAPGTISFRHNGATITLFDDLTVAHGGLVARDGAVAMTGALAFGGNKITGLGSGTAAGDAVTKSQVDGRKMHVALPLGLLNATVNRLFFASAAAITATAVSITVNAATTSTAGNRWTIQIRNVTAALDLLAAAFDTNGNDFAANTRKSLGTLQNTSIAAADVLRLEFTKVGSATDLSDTLCVFEFTIATS